VAVFPRRRTQIEGVVLDAGERILASASGDTGTVAATDKRLLVPGSGGHHGIGWETVDRATWDGDDRRLTITQSAPPGFSPQQHRLRVEDAAQLLDVVREQVTASMVISRYVLIDGTRGVRISGRRQPGRAGLMWVVAVDKGLSIDAPSVRPQIEAAVASVRAEVE
jgi:hypothetical protein